MFAAHDTYLENFNNRVPELLTLCELEYFLEYTEFKTKQKRMKLVNQQKMMTLESTND